MRIIYSPQFKSAFHNIVECSHKYYSRKVISIFYKSLRKHKDLLVDNPRLGQREPLLIELEEDYRYVILHKYLKLVYYIQEEAIYFVDIWDTRQSPLTLKSRID